MSIKAYTKIFIDTFNDVWQKGKEYYNIELIDFNFKANESVNFAQFRNLKKILDKELFKFYGREPTQQEFEEQVRILFKRGFLRCYYYRYVANLTHEFSFSPLYLYVNYSKIVNFKMPKITQNLPR